MKGKGERKKYSVLEIAVTGVCIALTFVMTFINLLAMIVACVIKIVGYYIAEGIIYGNWIAPVASIPGNLVQVTVAMVIVLPVAEVLCRAVHTVRFS